MTKQELLRYVDHTLLAPTATEAEIRVVCDDAIKYNTATICIPNSYVAFATEYTEGKLAVGTVIGFPSGYNCTEAKCAEARLAIADGASEIDMVASIYNIKNGRFDLVEEDIRRVKDVCGSVPLKVIIETCLLTEDEKIRMCSVVAAGGADYIKTSTGFSKAGATREDIALFAAHVPAGLKIKAAGGIRSFEDAADFVALGAHRLGTSALVRIMKNEELASY